MEHNLLVLNLDSQMFIIIVPQNLYMLHIPLYNRMLYNKYFNAKTIDVGKAQKEKWGNLSLAENTCADSKLIS